MLFLVDENCDAEVTRALRKEGHDVLSIAETHSGSEDSVVIGFAVESGRILVTEDKDFGQLVYASGHGHNGVIFLRYPYQVREPVFAQLLSLVRMRGISLQAAFTVIEPGRVRISPRESQGTGSLSVSGNPSP